MKNKLRFLMKNKQSFIAWFVMLAMVFNACSDATDNDTSDFTPMYFYVDSSGNFTETDSGSTVVVADKKAQVVFYSDNLASNAQRVGLAFEDKTIIFLFEKNQNFPTGMLLSDSEESYKGTFTSYDSAAQTYGLTLEQGGEKETLSNVALSKDVFTQYKDDKELTSSQNLRMRNLYIATCIYKSLNDHISSDGSLQARGIVNFFKKVGKFFTSPVVKIVFGVGAIVLGGIWMYITGGDSEYFFGAIGYLIDNINEASSGGPLSGGSSSGGGGGSGGGASTPTTVAVTGVSLNKTSVSLIVGADETLVPTITPANATNKTVSWSSSNYAVATVSNSGVVTGLSVGTASITVTTQDGNKTATCSVTVTAALPKIPTFTSVADFKAWLDTQPNNTKNTPYAVALNLSSLEGLATALGPNKYVNLDFSGSTFTSIGGDAFYECTSFTGVTIPGSVTSIEDRAFGYCTSLTVINVGAGNSAYSSENGVLYNENKTTLIRYPVGKTGSFNIPKGVISIGSRAFNGCNNLTSVFIPDSVTGIGSFAFAVCTGLTSVTIPGSVTSIGEIAFSNCTGLISLTIETGVTSIGDQAFYECTSLTSVTIPGSVTSIGVTAFSGCTGLTSIAIPASINVIGKGAFATCTSLTSVKFEKANISLDVYGSFPGDLDAKYRTGGIGTYTTKNPGWAPVWTKQ